MLPLGGDAAPTPFLETSASESYASLSPNGRWMAYVSDEQGDPQVFVRSVPPSNALWQISTATAGGTMLRWCQDGRELFCRAPDGVLTAVAVGPNTAREGGAAAFDYDPTPTSLFGGIVSTNTARVAYQPSADGERFAVLRLAPGADSVIVLAENWLEELQRLDPTN